MNSAEFYDPQTNRWTNIPNMSARRSGVSCIGKNGILYVMGGFNGIARTNTCAKYCPLTETWSPIKDMYYPRSNFGIEIIDDMIYVFGGFTGLTTISHAECYVLDSNEW